MGYDSIRFSNLAAATESIPGANYGTHGHIEMHNVIEDAQKRRLAYHKPFLLARSHGLTALPRLLALLCLSLALWVQAAGTQEELVFCYENENVRPWRSKTGAGLNFELLDSVAAELKLRFRYEGTPWKRCLFELKGNLHAGAIGASFKPERIEYGSYPGSSGDKQPDISKLIYLERYVVVRRKGSQVGWNGSTFEQLNRAVGAPLGYSVVDDLKKRDVQVDDGAHTAGTVLQKLMLERIDAAILLQGEMGSLLAEDARLKEKLEILPKPFAEKPYYLLLSHQLVQTRPELAARIWATTARIRATPAYQEKERRALELVR